MLPLKTNAPSIIKKILVLFMLILIISTVFFFNVGSGQDKVFGNSVQVDSKRLENNPAPLSKIKSSLYIKELDVTILLPDGITDLTYYANKELGEPDLAIYFSSLKLESSSEQFPECIAKQGPLGAIYKSDKNPQLDKSIRITALKEVGGSFYIYQVPHSLCSNNRDMEDTQASQMKLLQQAISTIEEKN